MERHSEICGGCGHDVGGCDRLHGETKGKTNGKSTWVVYPSYFRMELLRKGGYRQRGKVVLLGLSGADL